MTVDTASKDPNFFNRMRGVFQEYPRQFWILVGGTFIDRLGGALLFPFFTLYLTRKFSIGMTQVGVIFGLFAVSSFFGSMIGGAVDGPARPKEDAALWPGHERAFEPADGCGQ